MTAEEHYLKGMDLFSEDELEEAIGEFEAAVAADPRYADPLHALAMCYYHRRDFDNAIAWGLRYRDADPDSTLAYTSLSMFYQAKGMIPEAEEMAALSQQAAAREKAKS